MRLHDEALASGNLPLALLNKNRAEAIDVMIQERIDRPQKPPTMRLVRSQCIAVCRVVLKLELNDKQMTKLWDEFIRQLPTGIPTK